jgi:hypothetical protein
VFGCGISGHVGRRRNASERRHIDDPALTPRSTHGRQESLDAVHDAEHVHVERAAPPCDRCFLKAAQVRDAGVVHQDVERSDGSVRGGRQSRDRGLAGDVTSLCEALDAHAADFELDAGERRLVRVADHEVGAPACKRTCTFETDARGRARDQYLPAA